MSDFHQSGPVTALPCLVARPIEKVNVRPAAVFALLIGVTAAAVYCVQSLTLSHYDAKAHLVVARRVVDSLRPGWCRLARSGYPFPTC